MRQTIKALKKHYKNKCIIASLSMQGVIFETKNSSPEQFLKAVSGVIHDELNIFPGTCNTWSDWIDLFAKKRSKFKKPLIIYDR